MKRQRASTWVVAVLSVALVAGGTLALVVSSQSQSPPVEFGSDADMGIASASPAASTASPMATSAPSIAASPTATAAPSSSEPARAEPVRIVIPAISVRADVVPVGLDKARAVRVPDDISVVGWYRYSVPPGSAQGSSVLVGHRDGRVDGHGAFYGIGDLHKGDRIDMMSADGSRYRYEVTALRVLAKSAFEDDAEVLFRTDGPPRLRLISCGGYYDADHGGYQANVIVTAVPVNS